MYVHCYTIASEIISAFSLCLYAISTEKRATKERWLVRESWELLAATARPPRSWAPLRIIMWWRGDRRGRTDGSVEQTESPLHGLKRSAEAAALVRPAFNLPLSSLLTPSSPLPAYPTVALSFRPPPFSAVIINKFRFCLAHVPWNYKVRQCGRATMARSTSFISP